MNVIRNRALAAGLLAAGSLAFLPACHRLEQLVAPLTDHRKAFAALPVGVGGATRGQVITAMGQPQSTRTFGLISMGQAEMLAFVDAANEYLVLLYNDRAVMKHAAPRIAEKAREVQP